MAWGSLVTSRSSAQTLTFDRAMTCASGDGNNGWGPREQVFDSQGNLYIVGSFNGTIVLGSTILTATRATGQSSIPADCFLAKLDPVGNYLWAVQINNNRNQTAGVDKIALDSRGDLYVIGGFDSYSATLGLGGPTLYNSSARVESFVGKVSGTTGRFVWARRMGGTGSENVSALAVNAADEVYVVCNSRSSTLDFGPFTLTNPPISPLYYNGTFLAKLGPTGTWLFARQTGVGVQDFNKLQLDQQGNIYISGTFLADSLTFGATHLTARRVVGSPNYYGCDIFAAKTNDAGAWLWAVQGDAQTHQNIITNNGMVVDGAGHLYLTGAYASTGVRLGNIVLPNSSVQQPPQPIPPVVPITNNYYLDGFVAQLNANTGAWEQAVQNGGPYDDYVSVWFVDAGGHLCVTTHNYTLSSVNVHLTQPDWARRTWYNSQVWSLPFTNIALDRQNRFNLAGSFDDRGPLTLSPFVLQPDGPGRETGFLARLAANPLAMKTVRPTTGLQVWPNPAGRGPVWVQGPAPGQAVQLLDALGRQVSVGQMPAAGPLTLSLPAVLPTGLYMVRSAAQVRRLVVE